ncbi:hypothetical protein [Abyssalbus ytuae]|uniref:DNA topoisomerase IV n=1 Tax=Abyssalbus ytuae TaxID=2926907 RepID=A0A9E7CT67_9FLAO|nr:hypothetical protein [Abyssalbus ytuae]UOB17576.1 hypothetical protein MQE35_17785 [Abyssalbus ytuae]
MRYFFYLAVFIFTSSCFNVERDCKSFKTGKFEFNYIINGKQYTGSFIRKDNLQIEYYNGKTDTSEVRWVNDCEFISKIINPKSMAEEKPVHIKILTTSKDSYTFEYSIVGDNKNKQRGTAKKID